MSDSKSVASIQERFDALLLSYKLASALAGKRIVGEVTFVESEQGDARRQLLNVEKKAAQTKLDNQMAFEAVVEKASNKVHDALELEIAPILSNGEEVLSKVLYLREGIAELLDMLSTRACTVSKLEPIVMDFPWLQDDLLRTINSAEHRRIDDRGNIIVVESIRTALSYFGLENLRKLIPFMILKHTIPQITDPYPQIKARLSEYYLAVANACSLIAEQRGQNTFNAYVLGMLSGVGVCATWRLFFRTYDKVLTEALASAMNRRDQPTHTALQKVKVSPNRLSLLKKNFANTTAVSVFEHLPFNRLILHTPLVDDSAPLAKTLLCAQHYAKLKLLVRFKLIEKEEVKESVQSLNLSRKEFEAINKVKLFNIQSEKFSG